MVENIIISKQGSESTDAQRKIFSSTTPWSCQGENLVVYINDKMQTKNEYSIIDDSSIELSSSIKSNDTIKFLITKLTDVSQNYSPEDRTYQVDRMAKKMEGKVQSSINKRIEEESIPTSSIITPEQVWTEEIDPSPETAQSHGVAVYKEKLVLTEDETVAHKQGWFVSESGNIEDRIKYWIGPRFGRKYNIRLFDANNVEIPSSDPIGWKWDYEAGYLTIQSPTHNYSHPFKISGYIYTGQRALDQQIHWKEPVFSKDVLPLYHNDDGDIRLVLTENVFYRFDAIANIWRRLNYGSDTLRDPVPNKSSLPQVNNQRGDLRLVLEDNDIYSWDDLSEEWILLTGYSFNPENYYQKDEIDSIAAGKADSAHTHDGIYYRKNEIDNLVRWRPPRSSFDDLPPYTENRDGDVIITLDTSTVYRWVASDPNTGQGQWEALVESNFTWKGPVEEYSNLPVSANSPGDVRLVKSEEKPYWWNGSEWSEVKSTIVDHDHDGLYLKKENLYWKAPVSNFSSLPTANNNDGDIRLTFDNYQLYRFSATHYQWEALTQESAWKAPVDALTDLPTTAEENDLIFVKESRKIYYWSDGLWRDLENKDHDHNDEYYTKSEIEDYFNISSGHSHNGVNSKQIDYNNLLNIPYFYWKNPIDSISNVSDGENPGDARIALDERALYVWTGLEWVLVSGGEFSDDHNHDTRYYTQAEVDNLISTQVANVVSQISTKAEADHGHDERYYQKSYIDDKFDSVDGHNHDGVNSRKIDFYDLENLPDFNQNHDHDQRYYTKTQLASPGQAQVHYENILNMPGFTSNWKNPVQEYTDLPGSGNDEGDLRIVLSTHEIYSWSGTDWEYVGQWDVSTTSHWKDPVDLESSLPQFDNLDGDVRLVLANNTFYRWNEVEGQWKAIQTAVGQSSSGVSLEDSLVMVFLNGLNLQQDEEWEISGESSISLNVETEAEDRVAVVVYDQFNEFYRRFDFTAFNLQSEFIIGSEPVYRQETTLTEGQTTLTLASPYEVGSSDLMLWWNGLLQQRGEDYFETSSTEVELVEPAVEGDIIIALIFDTQGTNSVYSKEEHEALEGQAVFELEYPYKVGKNQILVYYNGQLQQAGEDYTEVDSSTVEMADPCHDGEKLTFMIFNASVSSGEGDIQSACSIPIGLPADGTWSDGLFNWTEDTLTCNALDDVNEALMSLSTSRPSTLSGDLVSSEPLSQGWISDGNTNVEDIVGVEKPYLINKGNFTLTTPEDTLLDADKGVLKLFINGQLVDSFNLRGAFVESDRSGGQTAHRYGDGSYSLQDVGAPASDGLRESDNGLITIMFVSKYSTFPGWQYGEVRVNIDSTIIESGYNEVYLSHQIETEERNTNIFKFFYDDSANNPVVSSIYVQEEELNSNMYLSGVRYYSIGDEFSFSFVGENLFDTTYTEDLFLIDFPGVEEDFVDVDSSDLSGVSSVPHITDIVNYSSTVVLNNYGDYSIDSVLDVVASTPFEDVYFNSQSDNILINTKVGLSNNKTEYFFDEQYRLPIADYDTSLTMITGQWNGFEELSESDALIFDGSLQFANMNFNDYLPAQSVDYSGRSANQYYLRAFKDVSPHNNGKIQIVGFDKNDLLSEKIIVELKLPGVTGWLTLNKKYDISEFDGSDGDGCLVDVDGDNFHYSSGYFSTAYCDNTIIMRITMKSNSPSIEEINIWSE